MDQALVEGADGDDALLDKVRRSVEGEHDEILLFFGGILPQQVRNVRRRGDLDIPVQQVAAAEFDRSEDLGGFGLPHAVNGNERVQVERVESGLEAGDDLLGKLQHVLARHTAAEHHRHEFVVPERRGSLFQQFFARAVARVQFVQFLHELIMINLMIYY